MAIGALVETMKPSLSYYIGYAQKKDISILAQALFFCQIKKLNLSFFLMCFIIDIESRKVYEDKKISSIVFFSYVGIQDFRNAFQFFRMAKASYNPILKIAIPF